MSILANRALGAQLVKSGLMPDHCRLMEIVVGVDGGTLLKYEKYLTTDEAVKLAAILVEAAAKYSQMPATPPPPSPDLPDPGGS